MSENEKPKTIDYFVHEGVMTQMSMAMDRVQKAMDNMKTLFIVTVCALAFALAVCAAALVVNDTLWREHCATLDARYQTVIEEVQNAGVYEQPDTGSD